MIHFNNTNRQWVKTLWVIFLVFTFFILEIGTLYGNDFTLNKNHIMPTTQTKKIIGGFDADPNAWPWMAALINPDFGSDFDGQICGGSLIHPNWVLTAAHCVYNAHGIDFDILLGRSNLKALGGEKIGVKNIIIYPNYDDITTDGDLALLELQHASSITPVSIIGQFINSALVNSGDSIAIGWGDITPDSRNYPAKLQQVTLPVITNTKCQEAKELAGVDITENMLCAGYETGGKDSCSGDSGGPLFIANAVGDPLQIGITSFGIGCALPDAYGVYTRVSRFTDWITSQICSAPELPTGVSLKVKVSGNNVDISFNPVQKATGYQLYYAPYPSANPVEILDLGPSTNLSVILDTGIKLFVAIRSYNGNCMGSFSNLEYFEIK